MEIAACTLLAVQGLLGAWDNFWNHELKVRLPSRPEARKELWLHAIRGLMYAPIFLAFGWLDLAGWYAVLLALLLSAEIVITLLDFVEEDRSRVLPANERVLHTILTINYGAFIAIMAPHLVDAALQPSSFAVLDAGPWAWLFSAYAAGTALWGTRDAIASHRFRHPALATWQRRRIMVNRSLSPKVVLVAGGTGFVGREICWRLIAKGHCVLVFARDGRKATDLFGPHARIVTNLSDVASTQRIDAIVNLAGEPIAGWWWTPWRKALLVESRIGVTRQLLEWAMVRELKPAVLVNASAVGWYGARGDEMLDESAAPGEDFPARLCHAWEREALYGTRSGMRVVALRLGLVLGNGGLLARMLPAFSLGLGAPFGRGDQWMPWIHLDDAVDIFERALKDVRLSGQVNAVAPTQVTNRQFSKVLASLLRRPLWPAIPAILLRSVFGELATLFLDGQRVVPGKLSSIGHRYRYPALPAAFADVIRRSGRRSASVSILENHV